MKLNRIVLGQKRKPWYLRLSDLLGDDSVGAHKHARGHRYPKAWRRRMRAARKRERVARKAHR